VKTKAVRFIRLSVAIYHFIRLALSITTQVPSPAAKLSAALKQVLSLSLSQRV